MDLSHIFYNELPVDGDNIFSASLAESNEIEEVSLKKIKNTLLPDFL